ncbi:MAG: flagellar hook-associated protein FlgL [Sulfuricella sp.]|nr:flagellar hook-associated protein FlgL [Sulfuricella sp.]
MRISTSTMYDMGVNTIQQQLSDLMKVQQQVSSNKNFLAPSDNPVAAAKVLDVSQSKSLNDGYGKNILTARNALETEESTLGNIGSLIEDAKSVAVNAGNPTLSAANRLALATDLRGKYAELVGLANRKDANGEYLFSGYKGSTVPYTQVTGAGSYQGDQGQRMIQINASRSIEMSDPGYSVFKPGTVGDAFKVISDLADALDGTVAFSQAAVNNALDGLDQALGNVLKVRTAVGGRLNELDTAQSFVDDVGTQYQQVMSQLQDVDYATALTNLTKQQTILDAAQKSFMKVQGMSLFNYMS